MNYDSQGNEYWVDIDITPISDENGVIDRFIAIERDVTEYKKLESKLTTTAKEANAANEAKSAFLATMSHEIRTPINGVLGMTQLLGTTPLNSVQRHYVDILMNAGKSLLNVINDILDLSKVEAFIIPKGIGVNYNPGIWHFPLISTEDMNFLVVDRKGEGDNLIIHNLEKENITIDFQL